MKVLKILEAIAISKATINLEMIIMDCFFFGMDNQENALFQAGFISTLSAGGLGGAEEKTEPIANHILSQFLLRS